MSELTPWGWFLAGCAGFITIAVITYVILRRNEKREPVEWTEEHYR